MPDDLQFGNDWYHPLHRARSRETADRKAESYRQQGYKARVKPMQDSYFVYVSENPAQRAAPRKKKSGSRDTAWWDGPIPF